MEPLHLLGYAGVVLAVTLIGVTKGGFGAGVGLMVVPLTGISLGLTPEGSAPALGLLLPLLILGDGLWKLAWPKSSSDNGSKTPPFSPHSKGRPPKVPVRTWLQDELRIGQQGTLTKRG